MKNVMNVILYLTLAIVLGTLIGSSPTIFLAVFFVLIIARCIYVIPSKINIDENGMKIGNTNLKYSDVLEVNLLDKKPTAFRLCGAEFKTQVGDFWVQGYGLSRVYTKNSSTTIFIKTKRRKFFINLENEEETTLKYKQILNEVNKITTNDCAYAK